MRTLIGCAEEHRHLAVAIPGDLNATLLAARARALLPTNFHHRGERTNLITRSRLVSERGHVLEALLSADHEEQPLLLIAHNGVDFLRRHLKWLMRRPETLFHRIPLVLLVNEPDPLASVRRFFAEEPVFLETFERYFTCSPSSP
ncbi:MAG: hypothetical protein Q7R83_00110 [bacterium]|nr:hypothetical protein [bacterium]